MADETDLIDGFLQDAEAAIAHGALSKAMALYQGVLSLDETNLEALTQAAAISLTQGDTRTALFFYSIAVEHHSKSADVHHGLSAVYRELGFDDKAEISLSAALRIEPDHQPSLFDQAVIYQKKGELHKADANYLKIAVKDGRRIDAIFNRGVVMFRKGNLKAAERWFREAAKIDPHAPRPLVNLALIYRYWGYFDAADRCLRHVVEHHPDFVDAQWNLANLELLLGNLKDGFPRAEWRFRRDGFNSPKKTLPRWDGGNMRGRKILLVVEQGFGDTIQMVRFAKVFADQGAYVGIEAQPALRNLLRTAPGVSETIHPGDPLDAFDAWVPVMSIPATLKLTLNDIPNAVPYLSVPPAQDPINVPGEGLKVGIVWQGNPKHENNRYRSIKLSHWEPLFDVTGVKFVSLQVDASLPSAEENEFVKKIHDATSLLTDFGATAAVIDSLDLVITVDTAVAHLAGALGKPTWLLVSPANDWRWMTERDDSPWYPTMRIYRSKTLKLWDDVMTKVAADLGERVSLSKV